LNLYDNKEVKMTTRKSELAQQRKKLVSTATKRKLLSTATKRVSEHSIEKSNET